MAQKVQVLMLDDLDPDGPEADETVAFSLDGTSYEIDLTAAHAAELRTAYGPYVEAGRRTTSAPAKSGRHRASTSTGQAVNTTEVREWARSQGIEIKERGRIPADVVAQFRGRRSTAAPAPAPAAPAPVNGAADVPAVPELKLVEPAPAESAPEVGQAADAAPTRQGRGRRQKPAEDPAPADASAAADAAPKARQGRRQKPADAAPADQAGAAADTPKATRTRRGQGAAKERTA